MAITHSPTVSTNSESTNPHEVEAKPVEDLWFEDGNLILRAEDSLFRIYSGLLAARSSVFKDMLAFPPPEEGNPMLDGCCIVSVFDSASDMSYFLRAVFDSSYFEPPPTRTELPIVEAVLRLSLKYDVQYLQRRALAHLSSTFPTTLAAWKTRDAHRTIPPVDNTPFAAFRIAREFDLPWLIPSIIYCISSHPLDKTLDGAPWVDSDGPITLAQCDQRAAILGRQRILQMQTRSALGMAELAGKQLAGCTGEEEGRRCARTRTHCADILGSWDMAGFLDYFDESVYVHQGFCESCRAAFKARCGPEGQAMWDTLPEIFGLPDWAELEKQKVWALE